MAEKQRITPLSKTDEEKVKSVATDLFANDENLQKGAVIYGRKLMKFVGGKRTSRPPVPPTLQSSDRKITRDRCVSIANALGVDLEKAGLAEKTETAPKKQAKPDPKPAAKKQREPVSA